MSRRTGATALTSLAGSAGLTVLTDFTGLAGRRRSRRMGSAGVTAPTHSIGRGGVIGHAGRIDRSRRRRPTGVARLVVAALAALAVALACSPRKADEPSGDADVGVRVDVLAAQPTLAAVWVHLTGTTAGGAIQDRWVAVAEGPPGAFSARLAAVPVGSYFLSGRAFVAAPADPASASPDFETVAPVALTVGRGSNPAVVLTLQQRTPPRTSHNRGPVVDGVVLSTLAYDPAGEPLRLSASAHDPDPGDALTFAWTAAAVPAAAGAFSTPGAASTTWAPGSPSYEGTVTFTFSATDPLGVTASVSAAVSVSPAHARGSLDVPLAFNHHPDLTALAASNAQLAPGAEVDVGVTAADADGDPLLYAWTDGCGGAFVDASAQATRWRAPDAPAVGPCTLSVTVRDARPAQPAVPRGGEVTGTLTVNVSAPVAAFAPEFRFAMQGPANPVPPGATVFFAVEAFEWSGGVAVPVLDLAWSGGAHGDPVPWASNPAYVVWTAPACGGATAPLAAPVTVAATGSGGAASSFEFPVAVQCGP